MNTAPKITNIVAQMRVTALVDRIRNDGLDAAGAAEAVQTAAESWSTGANSCPPQLVGDMLDQVKDRLLHLFGQGGALPVTLQNALYRPQTATPVTRGPAAPPTYNSGINLAAEMGDLSLANSAPPARGASGNTAVAAASVGGKYVPSEKAKKLLAHYQATKEDYAPMAKRQARLLVQEQKAGTSEWQDTMDAVYVVGSIILDQRDGKSGLTLKYFNGDETHEIATTLELLKKMNAKTKPTKIPAFSDNFQTALWDYLRLYEDNKSSKNKIEQESIYLVCTGADNDSSTVELKEAVDELRKMKLPPKQMCAAAIRVGDNVKGAAKLAALDDPKDESMRDIFDAPYFSGINPDQLIESYVDEDGDEAERDAVQKLTMGLFNKDLD